MAHDFDVVVIGSGFGGAQELKGKYYPNVSSVLDPAKIPPNQFSNRTRLLREAARKAGFENRYEEVELAVRFDEEYEYDPANAPNAEDTEFKANAEGIEQGFCVHLGQCPLGCPVEARNTLALNYIPRAERFGAEVRPLHIVRRIEPEADGYRVHYDRIQPGGLQPGSVSARIAIVAAGSVGSTELLLRCRDQYKTLPNLGPRLGHNWCSNANYLTLAAHRGKDVFPTRDPTISAAIKFLGVNHHKGSRFVIEDGGFPSLLEEYRENLKKPSGEARHFENALKLLYGGLRREPLQNIMPWFAQGRDEPVGRFSLRRWFLGILGERRNLHLSWSRQGARKVLDAIREIHRALAKETAGKVFIQLPDALITPHPLGGCPMGNTAADGVVDHRGAVFGYKNLYVADGAIIPRAIGHNPSKRIAALKRAHRRDNRGRGALVEVGGLFQASERWCPWRQ